MANDVEIQVTADTSNAEGGFKNVKSGFQSMKDSIVKNKKAIGLGIAAMGVGIEALAKSQAPLTESTRKLANATGFTEDEIRGMAKSLSNATFPLDSALELMTLGAQQGLESADALKEYAAFWDTVGDATGLSAEQLAKSGAALAAVGVEVGNEKELLGAFGLITQESTSSVQEFLDGIAKMAPEMSDMGISVNDAAEIMTAMERELGLTARTARTEFKEALEQSETGLSGVLEQLGLNEDQIAKYRGKLEESTGVIEDNAEAHASTKTTLDKLKSSLGDVVFQNGALLEKASMLAPIFMIAGPAIAGFGTIMGVMGGITNIAKIAMLNLNLSMGPILIAVVAVAAAIAIAIVIWKNWDTIINFLKNSIGFLKDMFVTAFDKIKAIFTTVTGIIFGLYESKLGWLLPFGPLVKGIIFLKTKWKDIWDKMKMSFDTIVGFIKGIYNSKLGWLLPGGALVKGIIFLKDKWREIFQNIKDFTIGIWNSIVSSIKGAINTIIGAINNVIRGLNDFKLEIPAIKIGKLTITPGFSLSLPNIPEIPTLAMPAPAPIPTRLADPEWMAHGGIVTRPTLAMLGESGPEAVIPLGRGGAGMTVNLVINGDINGMDDFEQKVTSVIRDAVLGGGFQGVLARA